MNYHTEVVEAAAAVVVLHSQGADLRPGIPTFRTSSHTTEVTRCRAGEQRSNHYYTLFVGCG